jgi:hypothetical protein
MEKLVNLYNLFKKDKRKERFDIILEPLQALTQLALLAFCPHGSKLSITNNLLQIQIPGWGQGLLRSYNQDKRDDMFFLFNAIVRFNNFYAYLKAPEAAAEDVQLFDLLIKLGKRGLDNILQTYAHIDQPSLLHTLHMYRTILENPGLVSGPKKGDADEHTKGNGNENEKTGLLAAAATSDPYSKKNIDEVFLGIRNLYSPCERVIILNLLRLLEQRPDQYDTYITSLNAAMVPINSQIKKWINDNIVY